MAWVCANSVPRVARGYLLGSGLLQEGIARDFIRQVQQLRKDANLEIQDRIKVCYATDDVEVLAALVTWADYVKAETLATELAPSRLRRSQSTSATPK